MKKRTADALRAGKHGQVGVSVGDMDSAIAYLKNTFGIGPWVILELCLQADRGLGPDAPVYGRIAMANAGTVQVELIQVTQGEGVHSEPAEGTGIHHLGFFVRDMDRRLAAARRAGVQIVQEGVLRKRGLVIRYAYLDTETGCGMVVEYLEARYLGIPFPMRSRLLGLFARGGPMWIE